MTHQIKNYALSRVESLNHSIDRVQMEFKGEAVSQSHSPTPIKLFTPRLTPLGVRIT